MGTGAVGAEEVAAATPLLVLEGDSVVIVVAVKRNPKVIEVDSVAFARVDTCLFDLADNA